MAGTASTVGRLRAGARPCPGVCRAARSPSRLRCVKLPRDLSGAELVACLCKSWGYVEVNRVGSHRVLETEEPSHHRLEVPDRS